MHGIKRVAVILDRAKSRASNFGSLMERSVAKLMV